RRRRARNLLLFPLLPGGDSPFILSIARPMSIARYFSRHGKAGRARYAFTGFLLVALKYNLDRILASAYFHRFWSPCDYFIPSRGANIFSLNPADRSFYFQLLLLAIPFIWIGTAMTLQRLRDCGLPGWLVFLFFIPLINLL